MASVVKRVQNRTRRLFGLSPKTSRLALKKSKRTTLLKFRVREDLAKKLRKSRAVTQKP